jgi:hypothetical protein
MQVDVLRERKCGPIVSRARELTVVQVFVFRPIVIAEENFASVVLATRRNVGRIPRHGLIGADWPDACCGR